MSTQPSLLFAGQSLINIALTALLCVCVCLWHRYVDAAKYLAEVQAAGKLQHIGVTNFDVQHLQQITDAGVRVVSNQVGC